MASTSNRGGMERVFLFLRFPRAPQMQVQSNRIFEKKRRSARVTVLFAVELPLAKSRTDGFSRAASVVTTLGARHVRTFERGRRFSRSLVP